MAIIDQNYTINNSNENLLHRVEVSRYIPYDSKGSDTKESIETSLSKIKDMLTNTTKSIHALQREIANLSILYIDSFEKISSIYYNLKYEEERKRVLLLIDESICSNKRYCNIKIKDHRLISELSQKYDIISSEPYIYTIKLI